MHLLQRFVAELGLISLVCAPRDTKLIILQRFTRFFAFGGSTIVLALYLHALKLPDSQIGLLMSLALVGDVISFGLALLADGIGRKVVLGFGALLMVFSGVIFAFSGNFWVLLAAGVVGIISPKYATVVINNSDANIEGQQWPRNRSFQCYRRINTGASYAA